jgi:peptidoglycan lytic transglycosylase G
MFVVIKNNAMIGVINCSRVPYSCPKGAQLVLKKVLLLILIPLFIIICAAAGFIYELRNFTDTAANTSTSQNLIVNVPPGQTLRKTADILQQKSIINSEWKFILIARIKGLDKKLKAGEYLLSAAMSPLEILEIMVKGAVNLHKLTVPEGYNISQIAALVENAKFGSKTDFIKTAADNMLLAKKGIEAETFEGYLFPDTYFFPRKVTMEQIISAMVNRFWSIFTPEWKARAKDLGYTVHQIVTLASIIEKETGAAFERPIISSVFHNRLKKKMRLESDPTVIYGIKNFDGNLTRKHLGTRTPYNTYKIRGLPVGPIANPGSQSLKAALYPEKTVFIYFVSKKDSTHYFSTNLKEHNRAVRKYQLKRKK